MPSSKKSPAGSRSYDASRRQADAIARQSRTALAAAGLFLDRGYGATSIAAIAEAADVSPQFVYAAFESKAGVLAKAVDFAVAGDTEDRPVSDRPEARAAMTDHDVDERVRRMVRLLVGAHKRAAPLIQLVEAASATDDALAELADKLRDQILKDLRGFAKGLPKGTLRAGLTPRRAGDILYALGAPRTWTVLVEGSRWSPAEYEAWLIDAVHRLVLA